MIKGFVSSTADTSLFVLHKDHALVIILLYVDDMLIKGSKSLLLQNFLAELKGEFQMKDLGSVHYFLGIQICNDPI